VDGPCKVLLYEGNWVGAGDELEAITVDHSRYRGGRSSAGQPDITGQIGGDGERDDQPLPLVAKAHVGVTEVGTVQADAGKGGRFSPDTATVKGSGDIHVGRVGVPAAAWNCQGPDSSSGSGCSVGQLAGAGAEEGLFGGLSGRIAAGRDVAIGVDLEASVRDQVRRKLAAGCVEDDR